VSSFARRDLLRTIEHICGTIVIREGDQAPLAEIGLVDCDTVYWSIAPHSELKRARILMFNTAMQEEAEEKAMEPDMDSSRHATPQGEEDPHRSMQSLAMDEAMSNVM